MIDPFDITDYNRTNEELEEFLLFCIFVANKPAERTVKVLEKFLNGTKRPLERIKNYAFHNTLGYMLRACKTGQYSRLEKCLIELVMSKVDLRSCSPQALESIHGIGPKTARYFILHSRKDAEVACLDTHALKFLKSENVDNVPKSTPTGKQYRRLEKIFIEKAKKSGKSIADFDLEIWKKYAKKSLTEGTPSTNLV